MQVPEYHDNLADGTGDAIVRIRDISEFFRHAERIAPRLRTLRLNAIDRCRAEGLTVAQIEEETGMKAHRINQILKERRRARDQASNNSSH